MTFVRLPRMADGVAFVDPDDPAAEDVIVVAGAQYFFLKRRIREALVPMLTGAHGLSELARRLDGTLRAVEITAAVQWMARHGAVVDAAKQTGPTGGARVSLQALGDATLAELPGALAANGLEVVASREDASLHIVTAGHYLHPDLDALNRDARAPWMLVRSGGHPWIGPIFAPNETGCWECLAHRLRLNGKIEQYVMRSSRGDSRALEAGFAPGERALLAAWAAQAARRWIDTGKSPLIGALIDFDPESLTMTRHPLVRRPQCPACGSPQVPASQPPDLRGGGRVSPGPAVPDARARQTLLDYAHHVSPITGLLPELTNRSRAPGIHVFAGGNYAAAPPATWTALVRSTAHKAAGKGLTEEAAKASALAETLEWYSLGAQDPAQLHVESQASLSRRARVIAPPQLAHFSAAQFADREQLNAERSQAKYRVPEPFDPERPVGWMKAWSLTHREWAFVPGAACCTSFDCPFVTASSNGNAAGATLAEATAHAALEAVERDAVALWWYNFAPRPQAALDGVDPGLVAAMNDHYGRIGRRFWLLDITTDLDIPVFAAVSVGETQSLGMPVMGFGAHFDPVVAATRALTELNQLQPQLVDFVPRDGRRPSRTDGDEPLPDHVFPAGAKPRRLADRAPDVRDGREQVEWLVERFGAHGLELLVADLTLSDVALPVVKALIPGLRNAYPEFGPGRLHDVPLAQGWIRTAVAEDKMRSLLSPL